MTSQQIQALRAIAEAIIAAVAAAGERGAPGGILYSTLMGHGCSLTQFQSLMAGLESAGKIKRHGELYFLA